MDSLDAYIQEVVRRHRIVLRKDDPILMLHTFLEKFLDDMKQDQTVVLENFSSALELEATKWDRESKEKASRIIAQALEKSRNLAGEQYDERSRLFCESIEKTLAPKLEALEVTGKKSWRIAVANMIAAGLLAMTGLLIWL
ncbi:MAG: hypothetical protein KH208_13275 [Desulfovibrio sp.]|uniref:hypothetical protein n=1 Tax=Desulfovibrio sp. TaxID=885 RepID=UPI0025BA1CD4|nr:hypothetical protein [Desulfovibrio sp.]MBS6830806.1 hypothetical protein [Desulfovibrio sp.]